MLLRKWKAGMSGLLCAALAALVAEPAVAAGPSKQVAIRIYERINGQPPTLIELSAMTGAASVEDAVREALKGGGYPRNTLYRLFASWLHVDNAAIQIPYNDFVATLTGAALADDNFGEALFYGRALYSFDQQGLPAYSPASNDHYLQAYANPATDFNNLKPLVDLERDAAIGDPAGAMTSRAFGEFGFKAGTNRRVIAHAFKNFYCRPLEQMHDNIRRTTRIKWDVQRQPAGAGSRKQFEADCRGCHAIQDELVGATAHLDWNDQTARLVYDGNVIADKLTRTDQNKDGQTAEGWMTANDSWESPFGAGQNKDVVLWKGATSGSGMNALGSAMAAAEIFPTCMAQHVFSTVCLRDPVKADAAVIAKAADAFKKDGSFKFNELVVALAPECLMDPIQ